MFMRFKLFLMISWYRLMLVLGLKANEIYYIGGSEALPPPLTKEEEEYLLGKLSTGDQAVRPYLLKEIYAWLFILLENLKIQGLILKI